MKHIRRGCDRCEADVPDKERVVKGRYRTLIDRFVCESCWQQTLKDLQKVSHEQRHAETA